MTTVSVLALVGAFNIGLNIIFYKQAVASDSAALREAMTRELAAAQHGMGCTAPPPSASTNATAPRMLLDSPAIGLSAPVLAGTSDHVLDMGVGHLDTSNWPDQGGVDILAAHNATFFVRLPDLKPGDTITLTAPCRKWIYKVDGGQVVTDTTALPKTADPKLALVTCWPINALFTTSQRYLLTADLVAAVSTSSDDAAAVSAAGVQTWNATLPEGLAGTDLSNSATGVATGRLTTAGTPSAAWQSSPNSLNAVGAAIQLFGGAMKTGRDQHPQWWSTLAPGVPRSALRPLFIGPMYTFRSPLNLSVTVTGNTLDHVTLTSTLRVGTGTYRIDATATPQGNRMSLTTWTMTLIGGKAPTTAPKPRATPTRTPTTSPKATAKPKATPTRTPTTSPKPAPALVTPATTGSSSTPTAPPAPAAAVTPTASPTATSDMQQGSSPPVDTVTSSSSPSP